MSLLFTFRVQTSTGGIHFQHLRPIFSPVRSRFSSLIPISNVSCSNNAMSSAKSKSFSCLPLTQSIPLSVFVWRIRQSIAKPNNSGHNAALLDSSNHSEPFNASVFHLHTTFTILYYILLHMIYYIILNKYVVSISK